MNNSQSIKRSSKQRDIDQQENLNQDNHFDVIQKGYSIEYSIKNYNKCHFRFDYKREIDVLIERLQNEQRQLKSQLAQKKIELYKLSLRFESQQGNYLYQTSESGVQLSKFRQMQMLTSDLLNQLQF